MPRAISTAAKQDLFAQTSDEAFILLVTIAHAALAAPIRVARNGANVTSRGNVFVAMAFNYELPAEDDSMNTIGRLIIQNVSQEITAALRASNAAAQVTLELVPASAPDTVEMSFEGFTLREARWDALAVQCVLDIEDFLDEAWPKDTFTPGLFPGIF